MSVSFCLEMLIYKFSISTILLSNRFKSESVKLFKWHTCFAAEVEEWWGKWDKNVSLRDKKDQIWWLGHFVLTKRMRTINIWTNHLWLLWSRIDSIFYDYSWSADVVAQLGKPILPICKSRIEEQQFQTGFLTTPFANSLLYERCTARLNTNKSINWKKNAISWCIYVNRKQCVALIKWSVSIKL